MKRHVAVAVLLLAGCPGKANYPEPPNVKTAADVVAKLDAARKARTSFKVETTMDYWLGKDRAKGTVWVMGTNQKQVRFNALKPSGDVLIDMACDGTNFTYVDFQNNCYLAGPCNKHSIATLLRAELEPEDFHDLAQGTPPMLEGATGTVAWDPSKGVFRVKLQGPAGTQNLVIDGRDNHFDVLSAELIGTDGKVVWSVENAGFHAVEDANKVPQRVPSKTRFKSPREGADLLVEWKDSERAINLSLPAAKFTVPIPPGLPTCGGGTPPPGQTSPGAKSP